VYGVDVKWNGVSNLVIQDGFVSWKGVNATFLTGDAEWSSDANGHTLRVKMYLPFQTTEWAPGRVGLNEKIELRFSSRGVLDRITGSFQRQGEGPLPCTASLRGRVQEARKAALPRIRPSVENDRENAETECPICFETFRGPGSDCVKVLTPCGHAFCTACVTSALAIRPPSNRGACPLCRGVVALEQLFFAHNRHFLVQS
jgi:hypothetical protein